MQQNSLFGASGVQVQPRKELSISELPPEAIADIKRLEQEFQALSQ